MGFVKRFMASMAMVTWIILPSPAAAETKLSDFNGEWRGDGTDRIFA